jgi:NAD(P)-dependent dehydrogenase (short-subunit alcohol dehydrogenase family)
LYDGHHHTEGTIVEIKGKNILVTGANRGLGRTFAQTLLQLGAAKVYAGARDPSSVDLPGAIAVKLDVTDPATIAEAARAHPDVDIVINNAGVAEPKVSLLDEGARTALDTQLSTNLFGVLAVSQAFAPSLRKRRGALVNVLSALSWISLPSSEIYSITKAAAWALTNGLRSELHPDGVQVLGVHVGYIDTDMVKNVTAPKVAPQAVVDAVLKALEAGEEEVLVDDTARQVKAGMQAPRPAYLGANLA